MLSPGFYGYLSLVFRVLRHLQIVEGDGAVLIEIFRAFVLSPGKNLIRDSHPVSRISARHVVAADGHEQLALLHRIPEARVDGVAGAGGERSNGDPVQKAQLLMTIRSD